MGEAAGRAGMRLLILLATAAAATLLHAFTVTPGTPGIAIALAAAAALIAACRPPDGLLLVAAFVPLGGAIGALAGLPYSFAEPLLIAVLFGAGLRRLLAAPTHTVLPPALAPAAVLLSLLAVASWVSEVAAAGAIERDVWGAARDGWLLIAREYFTARPPGAQAAALHVETMALLVVATRECRASRAFATRLLHAVVLGGSAAAVQSLLRLLTAAIGSGVPLGAAIADLTSRVRIAAAIPDVNATASFFALTIGAALAVAAAPGWRRAGAGAAAAAMAAALWITGSRAGVIAVPAAAILVPVSGWIRLVPAWVRGAVLTALAAGAIGYALYGPLPRPEHVGVATRVRLEFAQATARMLRERPVFGVGVGQYARVEAAYSSDWLRVKYPRDNAHNQFLQVAGELGLAGAVTFLVALGAALAGPLQGFWTTRDRQVGALLIGIAAFLLTCLSGHPLLLTVVAAIFAILLGVVNGIAAPAGAGRGSYVLRRAAIAASMAIVLLLPLRTVRAWRDVTSSGMGPWHAEPDGRRFRSFAGDGIVLVPSTVAAASVPLRLPSAGAPPVIVEVLVESVPVARVRVDSAEWIEQRVLLPRSVDRSTVRLTLRARDERTGEPREVFVAALRR